MINKFIYYLELKSSHGQNIFDQSLLWFLLGRIRCNLGWTESNLGWTEFFQGWIETRPRGNYLTYIRID